MMDLPASTEKKDVKIPAIFSWSGGKDSAYALHKILTEGVYEVRYLLSTFNGNLERLSMHGVREELIAAQAAAVGLPLVKVYVFESNNNEYEKQLGIALENAYNEGIQIIIFGDIFLEDLRLYREEKMREKNMRCIFPLWKTDTTELVHAFIDSGFKTVVCCVNDAYLNDTWLGKTIDNNFIQQLPPLVDPCGENGEFHSFCFDGPVFKYPILFSMGEKVYKLLALSVADSPSQAVGFWYIDLIPIGGDKAKLKTCPRCHQRFECNAGDIGKCHCSGIHLSTLAKQLIASNYEGCICPNCLQTFDT